MGKIWYISIDGKEEGPYSIRDLKFDYRVTPDTLAWKEGFESWLPIRDIPELKELFEEETPVVGEKEEKGEVSGTGPQDELVLDFHREPSFLFFWLIIAVVIICYVLYELYWG